MFKLTRQRSRKAGLPPGTLVHIGERQDEPVRITVIDYDGDTLTEATVDGAEACARFRARATTSWINVDGIHNLDVVACLGDAFGIHPLVLEDIVNADQRPKAEDFGDYVYLVFKMLSFTAAGELRSEQVSIILGPSYVLSFQEAPGDVFEPVRERLRQSRGKMRTGGPDYLAYALADAVVDSYFEILERFGENVEVLEEELLADPARRTAERIHRVKRELIYVRKAAWPMRELVNVLQRGDSPLVKPDTVFFLRDVYDHAIQVIDTVETFRDMLSGMLDLYLSSVSNRMNEVMKVLTIIATIFIPLTFVAGVYGMNFKFMPELGWRWGYAATWFAMAVIALIMVLLFKRKKWL